MARQKVCLSFQLPAKLSCAYQKTLQQGSNNTQTQLQLSPIHTHVHKDIHNYIGRGESGESALCLYLATIYKGNTCRAYAGETSCRGQAMTTTTTTKAKDEELQPEGGGKGGEPASADWGQLCEVHACAYQWQCWQTF